MFHMHCILQWINTPSSNRQCPMDRRPWSMSFLNFKFLNFLDWCLMVSRYGGKDDDDDDKWCGQRGDGDGGVMRDRLID